MTPLDQITPTNIGSLKERWRLPLGEGAFLAGSPLKVGEFLYLLTDSPAQVLALSLAHPDSVIWSWRPPPSPEPALSDWRITPQGGLAWHSSGVLLVALANGELAALATANGREIWRVRNADPATGAGHGAPPTVAGDLVLVGNSGAAYGVRGYLTAYRVANGQLIWRGYSTGPDSEIPLLQPANPQYLTHAARELGVTTWPKDAWRRGGGTVDGLVTWDPALDLIYHGTGPPAPWAAYLRPGDNKWASSILARERTTGKVRWAFQLTPGDAWGYGAAVEPVLAEITIRGVETKALILVAPSGIIYTLDRASGRLLVAERAGPANWLSQLDVSSGRVSTVLGFLPKPSGPTQGICPATIGIKPGGAAAWFQRRQLLVAALSNLCMDVTPAPPDFTPGQLFTGSTWRLTPGPGGSLGRIIGWDPTLGAVRWEVREPLPLLSGMLATASGIGFYATVDGWLKALDLTNGAERWRHPLPGSSTAAPISITDNEGRQLILIGTGQVRWPGDPAFAGITLPISVESTPGYLVAFSLHQEK